MKKDSNIKYLSEVELDNPDVRVKKPFKVNFEEKRRFIRLEISSPVSLKDLQEHLKQNRLFDDLYDIEGTILNISASGVLVDVADPLEEEEIVLMKFTLQETEQLKNILGLVKRAEYNESSYLAGIEFIKKDKLKDRLSHAEYELIADKTATFNEQIHKTLSKYLYNEN